MFKNKLIHIPVTNARPNNLATYNNHTVEWWGRDPIYKYDAVLMSAHYGMTYKNTRKDMNIRDDVLFFGDSGGYQLLQYKEGNLKDKKVLRLTPENVINWQLENCDIGMTLDIPTPRNGYTRDIFEHRLHISQNNAIVANNIVQDSNNKKFQLFNCIHGSNLQDMLEWYNITTQNCSFDGYSFPTGNSTILPLRLAFAMEYNKNKPFHILGASNARSVVLMACANKYMNTTIYFDSSAASQGTAHHKYFNHWNMNNNNGIILQNDWIDMIPCPCPICSCLDNFSDLCNYAHGTLITIHNLYWQIQQAKWIEAISNYPEEFKNYIKSIDKDGSLIRDINFINTVHDIGLEEAYNKFYMPTSMTEWE